MRVTIYLTDGSRIHVARLENALDLVTEWQHGVSPVLAVSLDGQAMTYLARAHVVRIDVDEPED